jgi:hypothetical protein
MATGVREVFPLQRDPDTQYLRQTHRLGHRGRATGVDAQEVIKLGPECAVASRGAKRHLELLAGRDKSLRHVAPTEPSPVPGVTHDRPHLDNSHPPAPLTVLDL